MSILDAFQKRAELPAAAAAAAILDAHARRGNIGDSLPGFDMADRHRIGALFYLTKIGITVFWLQSIEALPLDPVRAREVRDEFTNLTFSSIPDDARSAMARDINKLWPLLNEVSVICETSDVDSQAGKQRQLKWSEEWLRVCYGDIRHLSVNISKVPFVLLVDNQIQEIGAIVRTAVLGPDAVKRSWAAVISKLKKEIDEL